MKTTRPDRTTFFLRHHQLLVVAIAVSLLCSSGGVDAFVSSSAIVDFSLGRHTPPSSRYLTSQQHCMVREPSLPNFCADCGNPDMVLKIPDGDERLRACCDKCDRIEYQNPKVVVACVIRTQNSSSEDKDDLILFAKRAIEPRKGTWGIPQGFMENGETTRQAAVREVYEETGAIIDPSLLRFRAVYNVPGSVQLLYEARVDGTKLQQEIESYHGNHESLEVALLDEEMLAEKEICFPTVQWALDHCRSIDDTSGCAETNSGAFIQQMTKFYDADTDVWNQYEDEPLLDQ